MNSTQRSRTAATNGAAEECKTPSREAFLSWAEMSRLTGLSKTTIWREIRAGRFIQPVALSPNRRAFRASDYERWIITRGATRRRSDGSE